MFSFNKTSVVGSVNTYSRTTPILGDASGMSNFQSNGNFSAGGTFMGSNFNFPLLDGILDTDEKSLNTIFREIYTCDAVSGPAADMISSIPWSDYVLQNIEDDKILQVYTDSCAELNLQSLMSNITISYIVLGKMIGSLVFDTSRGIFTDIITHNPDDIEITPIPMVGYDPKLDLKVSQELRKFVVSKDPRDLEALKEISPDLKKQLTAGGKVQLEPLKTIYVSRSGIPGIMGFSLFHRILPIWVMEKALLRGSVLAATRRQRSVLHVQMGNEEWEPSEEEFASIAQLFANADRDPQGAIVTTRNDIMVSEFRNGSDFWKATDENDNFTNIKLRAMGLSESFNADTTYSNAEQGIQLFLESMRSMRSTLTNAVLRDKVFLLLAKYHKFRQRTTAELTNNIRYDINSKHAKRDERVYRQAILTGSRNTAEAASYIIPTIRWTKDLQPRGSQTDVDMLEKLNSADIGLPIPLSIMASAAGQDISTIVEGYSKDLEVRKQIQEYIDSKAKLMPKPSGDEGGFNMEASVSNGETSHSEPVYSRPSIITGSTCNSNNKPLIYSAVEPINHIHDDTVNVIDYIKSNIPDTRVSKPQAQHLLNIIKNSL